MLEFWRYTNVGTVTPSSVRNMTIPEIWISRWLLPMQSNDHCSMATMLRQVTGQAQALHWRDMQQAAIRQDTCTSIHAVLAYSAAHMALMHSRQGSYGHPTRWQRA
jgi:hypothetical protein